jgi:hypothetical protein
MRTGAESWRCSSALGCSPRRVGGTPPWRTCRTSARSMNQAAVGKARVAHLLSAPSGGSYHAVTQASGPHHGACFPALRQQVLGALLDQPPNLLARHHHLPKSRIHHGLARVPCRHPGAVSEYGQMWHCRYVLGTPAAPPCLASCTNWCGHELTATVQALTCISCPAAPQCI